MYEKYADDLNSINVFPAGKTFRVTFDPVLNCLRIMSRSRDQLDELREVFSVENKSAFFSQQYGYRGKSRLYNVNQFGFFQSGLIYDLLEWIKTQYGSLDCVAISRQCASYMSDVLKPLKVTLSSGRFELSNISDDTGVNADIAKRIAAGGADSSRLHELKMRPYQSEAIEALLFSGYGRGLIEIPTAGGKSFIISNFIWNLLKHVNAEYKTLILVPNVQLVEQFYGDMLEYGFRKSDLAKFEGGMSKREQRENDVSTAKVIIANRQFLFKNEKRLPPVDVLVCDEVHSCLAESSTALISRVPAKIRVGCSGTIPTDRYQRNQLVGMFGKIVYKEDITTLQGEGFISKLRITSVDVFDRQVDSDRNLLFHVDSTRKYVADDPEGCDIRFDDAVKAEHEYVAKWYKDIYSPVMEHVSKLDGNTLVLFDKIDIGRSLYEYFAEKYPDIRAYYNDGSTDVKERENTRSGLEESDGNVLFANVQILSTGVSIKRLHNLVFCFSSKSTVRIIQSCGRALRLHGDKEYANLYDVHFNYKYSSRHYKERLKLYKEYYNKSKPDDIIRMTV